MNWVKNLLSVLWKHCVYHLSIGQRAWIAPHLKCALCRKKIQSKKMLNAVANQTHGKTGQKKQTNYAHVQRDKRGRSRVHYIWTILLLQCIRCIYNSFCIASILLLSEQTEQKVHSQSNNFRILRWFCCTQQKSSFECKCFEMWMHLVMLIEFQETQNQYNRKMSWKSRASKGNKWRLILCLFGIFDCLHIGLHCWYRPQNNKAYWKCYPEKGQ